MKKYFIVTLALIFSCMATLASAQVDRDQAMRDEAIDAQVFAPVGDSSTSDGKASVYQLDGKAMITPKGSPDERALKVGDEIGIGDAVYTEKGASLSISFDNRKQNAVRIPAETKATFTSIEPTDIKLDDGTIFSVVNGLAKGSTWKVTTPTAVAAVRGTVFETTYHADTKEFFAATLDVPDDGKASAIEVQSLVGEGVAEVVEGKEISFKEGEAPSQDKVQEFTSDKAAEVQQFHQEVSAERQKSDDNSNNHGGGNGPGDNGGTGGTTGGGTTSGTGGGSGTSGGPASPFDGIKPLDHGPDIVFFKEPDGPKDRGPDILGNPPLPELPPKPPIFDNPINTFGGCPATDPNCGGKTCPCHGQTSCPC